MRQTPLHHLHVELGAKLVDFAGWEMPLLYEGIVQEHHHTRQQASMFDVSHMGRVEISGDDAETLLQHVCTRQLADAQPGQSRYSHVCNERGGIIDDVIVSRYETHWLVVCNAANRSRVVEWLSRHADGRAVNIMDRTEESLMIALQGPQAIPLLAELLPIPIDDLKRYHFRTGTYMFTDYSIFRSGYTGEDGIELILPAGVAGFIGGLLGPESGRSGAVRPAGLGARDTLRLEAGMPLHGHELHENVDSISAGLAWCVDLAKDFVGAQALRTVAERGPKRRLVGLELDGRRIARTGAVVHHAGNDVGKVTSGTFSPTLERSIAMAYVDAPLAVPGTRLSVQQSARTIEAAVVGLPFYRRS